jgi:hypothetical protein
MVSDVALCSSKKKKITHVGDYPMERALCVSETVLARCELAEILRRARHRVIE